MIEITCMRCGRKSKSKVTFNDKRLTYQVPIGDEYQFALSSYTDHLCARCQDEMAKAANKAKAEFLGIEDAVNIALSDGVLL